MSNPLHRVSIVPIFFTVSLLVGCVHSPNLKVTAESILPGSGNTVTLRGHPYSLDGEGVEVGKSAPDAILVRMDLTPLTLSSTRGRVKIISVVPSLDTKVCERQTHLFSERLGTLSQQVDVITVSMDLPFAQKRFSEKAKIRNMTFASDHRTAEFGRNYGLLIRDLRLLSRAVLVVDQENIIRHLQVVPELAELPDVDRALHVARELSGS